MTVMAMKVISADKHPNADALRLYKMKAPQKEEIQIIANLDRIYREEDIVAIAIVGSILKDGTKIKPTKLRGLYSYGMALGKVEAEVGEDLSDLYCQENTTTAKKLPFIKWTSIELLHNVKRDLDAANKAFQITYRAKIKLHGTNAGVQITTEGEVAAQKRTQIITPDNDNAGFAAWVANNIGYFEQLKSDTNITVFGEWCGSSIQKGVALSQIGRKIFAVFAIQYGGVGEIAKLARSLAPVGDAGSLAKLEIRPEIIRAILPEHKDIFVLPYYGEPIKLNFGDLEQLQTAAATINKMVKEVEKVDPWVRDNFGIEGTGEGLVMYPEVRDVVERENYTRLIFKAKGEKHQVVKTKQAVQIEPETARNIQEFVDLFVTEARLQQALTEACDNKVDLKLTGQFLKWISIDIHKESEAELAAADLTWKQVNKYVIGAARKWYTNKVTKLF